jgi:hypothetical protein
MARGCPDPGTPTPKEVAGIFVNGISCEPDRYPSGDRPRSFNQPLANYQPRMSGKNSGKNQIADAQEFISGISGELLLQLAADITQVIDGKFQGYRVNENQPWLIITAVDMPTMLKP